MAFIGGVAPGMSGDIDLRASAEGLLHQLDARLLEAGVLLDAVPDGLESGELARL
ncbi:hypothetical protein [Actinoplanes friuliensis]|uniref:hypothetical protein n=1 Tax=Actinoplanes friuliensis TaxID=196914 RepID=UPI00130E0773|nr:hypothetical protein [Actinoplanes friuliensis]